MKTKKKVVKKVAKKMSATEKIIALLSRRLAKTKTDLKTASDGFRLMKSKSSAQANKITELTSETLDWKLHIKDALFHLDEFGNQDKPETVADQVKMAINHHIGKETEALRHHRDAALESQRAIKTICGMAEEFEAIGAGVDISMGFQPTGKYTDIDSSMEGIKRLVRGLRMTVDAYHQGKKDDSSPLPPSCP